MALIRHAADRVTAAVSDDPHHMLARIASGLSSQLAGLSPSGKMEFGRVPGMANETKAIPAGLADLGTGLAQAGGALGDLAQSHGVNSLGSLQALRDGVNALQAKYGDLAPAWSRKAEALADQAHQATRKQMGLSDPHGFGENASEAAGVMMGQIPVLGEEEKAASLAGKFAKSPAEWLFPTIRPKPINYAMGTLAGGTMGTMDENDMPPGESGAGKEKFE
jgi:hypothetical protein